jgi:hypothetical protein
MELKKGEAEVHPTRERKRVLSYHIHLVSTLNIPNWYWVLCKGHFRQGSKDQFEANLTLNWTFPHIQNKK